MLSEADSRTQLPGSASASTLTSFSETTTFDSLILSLLGNGWRIEEAVCGIAARTTRIGVKKALSTRNLNGSLYYAGWSFVAAPFVSSS